MKLKRFFSFLLFAAVITAFTACDEDEDTSIPVDVTLNFTAPSDTITSFTWAEGKATFTDLNRGKEYELDLSQSSVITLSSGLYNITVEGAIASTSGEILCNVRSTKDNVQISAPSTSIALELSIYTPSNSLILKEIYVTGTANNKGTSSLYDKLLRHLQQQQRNRLCRRSGLARKHFRDDREIPIQRQPATDDDHVYRSRHLCHSG